MNEDRRIDWNYKLTEEDTKGGENIILPDGEYPATIESFERGQFAGNTNLQAGPMAVLTLAVDGGELGISRPRVNIILNQKLAWKIDQLAVSCGFWRKGEGKGKQMPWGQLKGCAVWVKVKSREYNGKTYQEIDRFLPPKEEEFPPADEAGDYALPDKV